MIVDGSESKATLDELHPATTYSVHVVAENTLGPGAASQELHVRTDEEAPSGAPRRVAVEAVSSTQLSVSWEPPPEDRWNGILRGHYVGYRELGLVLETIFIGKIACQLHLEAWKLICKNRLCHFLQIKSME